MMLRSRNADRSQEDGFVLVGLIVAIALILLVLSLAAPRVAQGLRREREVEAIRRGNQYTRAIQVYYRKLGHYPGSIEQLEKTNNMRFLRQRYLDPMTGKDDWRTIPVGQNKTTVKGFLGQPLAGIAGPGLGSAAGMASPGIGGAPVAGGNSGGLFPPGTVQGGAVANPTGIPGAAGAAGSTGAPGTTGGTPGFGAGSGIGDQSATSFKGGGGAFMGVGLNATGNSISTLNDQTTYDTWEFLYDPRIEALKAKVSLLGGVATGTPIGQAPGAFGATPTPGTNGAPGAPGSPGTTGTTTPTPTANPPQQ